MSRPSWDDYFLKMAMLAAERSTCLRHHVGAVLVRDRRVLATGYNGAARGLKDCIELGCLRDEQGIESGTRHEVCRAIHAEQNAIIHASRAQMLGATLYLYGENMDGSIVEGKPCKMCTRVIINAGIKKVVTKGKDGTHIHNVDDWIKDEVTEYTSDNIKGY